MRDLQQNEESIEEVMDWITDVFKNAKGLECEIFASSFIYLKKYPKASINEALVYGLNEWIK